MIINHKDLIGLSVETKSGLTLGKIKSFEVDSEAQTMVRYIVKSRGLIEKLLSEKGGELVVGRNQVISINKEKMVVEDNVVREGEAVGLTPAAEPDARALSSRMTISKSDGNF